jgi:hypothetical protein
MENEQNGTGALDFERMITVSVLRHVILPCN